MIRSSDAHNNGTDFHDPVQKRLRGADLVQRL